MSGDTSHEIELNIKEAKKMVELGKALERLRNNRDFKKLVIEHYLDREPVRLVHLKSDYNEQTAHAQHMIEKQMDSIGVFTQFLRQVAHQAMLAEKAIATDEETLEELRMEGAE